MPQHMRVASVEDEVPHELIDVAAMINYSAYSYTELSDKCAQLKKLVLDHGKAYGLTPRTTRTNSYRQVPAHIPDQLLEVFNAFEYPEMSKAKRMSFKMVLGAYVRSKFKLR